MSTAGRPSIPAALRAPFEQYLELLEQWSPRIDLVAPAPRDVLRTRHLADALEALRVVPPGRHTVADLGSGAGLPGIPWALARPDLSVTLVEPRARRVAFLRTACRVLGLQAEVRRERAAELAAAGVRFDGVVARALAPPPKAVALAAPLLKPGGWLCLLTGQERPGEWDAAGLGEPAGLTLRWRQRYQLPGVEPRLALLLAPPR